MIISPSIASGDALNLQKETEFVDKHFSNIHMDIQDGVYAKITFGMKTLEQVCSITTSKVSVHLQVMDPLKYLKPISKMDNIDIVHIHINHLKDPKRVISAYKKAGIKTGIGLSNYDLDSNTNKYFELVDSVLVLTACYGDPLQEYSIKMENYVKDVYKRQFIYSGVSFIATAIINFTGSFVSCPKSTVFFSLRNDAPGSKTPQSGFACARATPGAKTI